MSLISYEPVHDDTCLTCDTTQGYCSLCETGYYVSSNSCSSCSSQHYCNGLTQVGYCDEVNCVNAIAVPSDTGCCCESYCQDIVCNSGFSPVVSANGCCCE